MRSSTNPISGSVTSFETAQMIRRGQAWIPLWLEADRSLQQGVFGTTGRKLRLGSSNRLSIGPDPEMEAQYANNPLTDMPFSS